MEVQTSRTAILPTGMLCSYLEHSALLPLRPSGRYQAGPGFSMAQCSGKSSRERMGAACRQNPFAGLVWPLHWPACLLSCFLTLPDGIMAIQSRSCNPQPSTSHLEAYLQPILCTMSCFTAPLLCILPQAPRPTAPSSSHIRLRGAPPQGRPGSTPPTPYLLTVGAQRRGTEICVAFYGGCRWWGHLMYVAIAYKSTGH